MIKFFRKIRQNLLSEGKTGKYLTYALGEIILVVIGILIALWINNRNTLNAERKIEKTYLEALKSEFETNLEALNETIKLNEGLVKQLDELLSFFEEEKLGRLSSKEVAKTIGGALKYEVFYNPSTGVQTDIISSGNLKQLSDQDLRQRIASFGNTLKEIQRQENRAVTSRNDLGDYITEKISLRVIFEAVGNKVSGNSEFANADVKQLFKSMPIENNLILYQSISKTTNMVYYESLKKDIETILEIIAKELNPKK
ncbi:DUF6090 family protein [uncultured Croceitalea sp.]|uniref:DUF6090 family protein n=1 Tax=uncultured Croceitalea sp. TaxID=1798908 RepID=UPI00330622A2